MTCKDCKIYKSCPRGIKAVQTDHESDSYANYCDDFTPKHKSKSFRKNGYIAIQSNYNWHISVYEEATNRMILHAACTHKLSKRHLKKYIPKWILKMR